MIHLIAVGVLLMDVKNARILKSVNLCSLIVQRKIKLNVKQLSIAV